MLFAKGSRVRFKHTGDEGEVLDRIDDYMINVLLDDGDEIPAFLEDLERIDGQSSKPVKAKVVKIKKPVVQKGPDGPKVAPQYSILKSMGIQLVFDSEDAEGNPGSYRMYLINDTPFDVIFTFSLYINGVLKTKVNGKLAAVSIDALGDLPFDSLNDSPRVEIECWKVSTQGTGKRLYKDFRIKPQQFFKRVKTAPILNRPVHHYKVFEKLDQQTSSEEDLQTYTRRVAQPVTRMSDNLRSFDMLDPKELASFKPEIDLHIQKLTGLQTKMNKADILRLQLKHFEAFLEKQSGLA